MNGNHTNHVLWRFEPALFPSPSLFLQSFLLLDPWLGSTKADTAAMAIEDKIAAHRPAAVFDFCNVTSGSGTTRKVTDSAACEIAEPIQSPRQVAGSPRAENSLACQLTPIDLTDDSPVGLTDAQFNRLKAVFPDGIWTSQGRA